MPEMSGPELGNALKKARPDIHVMFMSGYSGGDLVVLNYAWALIDKPFPPKKLVAIVNVVLHALPNAWNQNGSLNPERGSPRP